MWLARLSHPGCTEVSRSWSTRAAPCAKAKDCRLEKLADDSTCDQEDSPDAGCCGPWYPGWRDAARRGGAGEISTWSQRRRIAKGLGSSISPRSGPRVSAAHRMESRGMTSSQSGRTSGNDARASSPSMHCRKSCVLAQRLMRLDCRMRTENRRPRHDAQRAGVIT